MNKRIAIAAMLVVLSSVSAFATGMTPEQQALVKRARCLKTIEVARQFNMGQRCFMQERILLACAENIPLIPIEMSAASETPCTK